MASKTEEPQIESPISEKPAAPFKDRPVIVQVDESGNEVEWITVQEAADRIGIRHPTVNQAVRETREGTRAINQLRSITVDGRCFIHSGDVSEYSAMGRKRPHVDGRSLPPHGTGRILAGRKGGHNRAGDGRCRGGGLQAKLPPDERKYFPASELTDSLREQISIFIRELLYEHNLTSAYRMSAEIAKKFREPDTSRPLHLTPSNVERWADALLEDDARSERLRTGYDIDRKRSEARHRRFGVLRKAMKQGDMIAANVALDRIQTLDGIAPEMVRVERTVAQMTDEELRQLRRRALEGLSIEEKAELIKTAAVFLSEDQWNEVVAFRQRAIDEQSSRTIPAGESEILAGLGDDL